MQIEGGTRALHVSFGDLLDFVLGLEFSLTTLKGAVVNAS